MPTTPLMDVIERLESIQEQAEDQLRYFQLYVAVGKAVNDEVIGRTERRLGLDDLPYGEEVARIRHEEVLDRLPPVIGDLKRAVDVAVSSAQGNAPELSATKVDDLEKLAESAEGLVDEFNDLRDDIRKLDPQDVRRYDSESRRW